MSNLKNATLVLRTSDLTVPNSVNTVVVGVDGEISFTRTQMTWNDVNLRLLLGDMYDSYDLFNLNIIQICSTMSISFGITPHDRSITLLIDGLPFINQTYNFKNRCNTNVATLCCFSPVAGQPFTANFTNNSLTFGKNQDTCDIRITYTGVNGDVTRTNGIQMPDAVFLFNIFGVTKEPSYNTDKRIF